MNDPFAYITAAERRSLRGDGAGRQVLPRAVYEAGFSPIRPTLLSAAFPERRRSRGA